MNQEIERVALLKKEIQELKDKLPVEIISQINVKELELAEATKDLKTKVFEPVVFDGFVYSNKEYKTTILNTKAVKAEIDTREDKARFYTETTTTRLTIKEVSDVE